MVSGLSGALVCMRINDVNAHDCVIDALCMQDVFYLTFETEEVVLTEIDFHQLKPDCLFCDSFQISVNFFALAS